MLYGALGYGSEEKGKNERQITRIPNDIFGSIK